jgi:putative hydrolase of the HAD superfamily
MHPRHLFFDAAGTLIKVKQPVGLTYAQIAASFHVRADPAVLDQAFRNAWHQTQQHGQPPSPTPDGERNWWRQLVHRTFEQALGQPPPATTFEALFDALYRHYAHPQAWQLYPDVRPALEKLHTSFTLHVLSNFDPRLIPVLQGLGIHPFFQHIILSSEAGFRKPDPRLFAHALARTGATPAHSLHVGDEPEADIQGAQNAGFQTFHVQRPQNDLSHLCKKLLS